MTNTGEIEVGSAGAMVIEQRGVVGGHGEKKCGAIALDIGVDACGGGARGRQDGGCAAREREIAGVAETVGEEETGYAEAAIAFVDLEDFVGIVMRADNHVVMKMHAAFGHAGRAGGVEPKGGVIFGGGLSGEVR